MFSPIHKDEIEVTIIGCGYGENIVMHVGNNDWIIVDSCSEFKSSAPYCLQYLREIGVNLDDVKLIIATHWHDDHISGISKILDKCPNATFSCSDALSPKEFLTIVDAYGKDPTIYHSGVKEFYEIIKILRYRKFSNKGLSTPKFSIAGRPLWSRAENATTGVAPCVVTSLSPSDASKVEALNYFNTVLPKFETIASCPLPRHNNHTSVVLLITVGKLSILLGSDLEETANDETGWSIIVNSHDKAIKANVFKIPHHGSSNGYCEKVWEDMLTAEPVALITPFINGSVILPSHDQMQKIKYHTKSSFITSFPESNKTIKRDKIVDSFIKSATTRIHSMNKPLGIIQLRANPIDQIPEWNVKLHGKACYL